MVPTTALVVFSQPNFNTGFSMIPSTVQSLVPSPILYRNKIFEVKVGIKYNQRLLTLWALFPVQVIRT
ncbi:hypothetical protein MTR_3g096360 [Medicago truncatula]|uniref:Uncharacterized protein n=1 Tax=Medicago truncatula TaxID=3880 RepID=G7JBL6_MEDTR|nr:hypothetical protein MTR_3g096360 [Medicago truncatula]